MPRETFGRHTHESVEQVAQQMALISEQIRASASLMKLDPKLTAFNAPRENSLKIGLSGMQAWADGLRDAILAAKMDAAKSVSDSPATPKKPKQK